MLKTIKLLLRALLVIRNNILNKVLLTCGWSVVELSLIVRSYNMLSKVECTPRPIEKEVARIPVAFFEKECVHLQCHLVPFILLKAWLVCQDNPSHFHLVFRYYAVSIAKYSQRPNDKRKRWGLVQRVGK